MSLSTCIAAGQHINAVRGSADAVRDRDAARGSDMAQGRDAARGSGDAV